MKKYIIPMICLVIIFILLIIVLPDLITRYFDGIEINSEAFLKQRNDYRTSLIQIGGGIVVVLGLYFTFRRIKAHENQVLQLQKQIQVQEEGQITERFTRAIEQLGSDNISIRLGGIYALERIAKDSFKDHWTVIEILTTYIKEKSPLLEYDEDENPSTDPRYSKPLGQDIQAILNVIGRRHWIEKEIKENLRLDLSHCKLDLSKFINANFENCNFSESSLRFTLWENSLLNKINFFHSNVDNSMFKNVKMEKSDFSLVDFSETKFHHCSINGSKFELTKLNDCELHDVDLNNSFISKVNFNGANIFKVDFDMANLYEVDFSDARLVSLINFDYKNIQYVKSFRNTTFFDESLYKEIRKVYPNLLDN